MGKDYYAFKLKPEIPIEEIKALVKRQALHFQSNPWFWASTPNTGLSYTHEILNRLHCQEYIDVSRKLKSKIDFIKKSVNGEEVIDSYRIFGFNLPVFPWMWRLDGYRTILPDELPSFLEKRKKWWDEVKSGKHRQFLARIYCHESYINLRENSELLKNYVIDWLSKPRTKKHLSKEFFDKVLHYVPPYSEPLIWLDPDHPPDWWKASKRDPLELADFYSKEVHEVVDLLREWNRNSSGKWKLQNGLHRYKDLESFLDQFENDWFYDLYNWAIGITKKGGGLCLDT